MISKSLKISNWNRYYTPKEVAEKALLLSRIVPPPEVCIDPSCGKGHLLDAATAIFGNVQCLGIDIDTNTIKKLRQIHPDWLLASRDLLNFNKELFTSFFLKPINLLLINPPFSLKNKKSIEVIYSNEKLKCSLAMAHILKSLDLFTPTQGAIAIIPESLLYSETDKLARTKLSQKYLIEHLADIDDHVFAYASVRTCIIKLSLIRHKTIKKTEPFKELGHSISIKIQRGGLPVYKSVINEKGLPFIHTTDLKKLARPFKLSDFKKISSSQMDAKGWLILLPRVGKPKIKFIRAVKFPFSIQLSDCVIALICDSKVIATQVEKRIKNSWEEFENLYRGTGARYITLSRLEDWLSKINIYKK